MKRRELLKNSFYMAGGLWLSQLAVAQKAFTETTQLTSSGQSLKPHFLVQITLNGGWHTSLSVDPWISSTRLDEKDAFIEYRDDQVIRSGNISIGPAMESLKSYMPKMTIINGVYLSSSDNGHESAQIYTMSGKGNGQAGFFSVELEVANELTPFGVLKNKTLYTGSSAVLSSSLTQLDQLSSVSDFDFEMTNPNSAITQAMRSQTQNMNDIILYKNQIEDLKKTNPQITDGHKIAVSFKNNLAATCNYILSEGNLDTHANHEGTHLREQTKMWESVKSMLDSFKQIEFQNGQSMFDVTTFFISSDFSRTPALDASKGTNHNPMNNSVLLISPYLKSDSVFGASRVIPSAESANGKSYLIAQCVDLKTGEIIKTKADAKSRGTLLKPEHVIATLADAMGVQRNIFSAVLPEVPSIASLIK
jgi:hypothetical protein